ncbi:MAG: amidohydrolase family protein [Deltaproteobacteria bacterium]|nr:amidohydrolase family protein [Deltaproteobacteria bacterium]
MLIKAPYIVTMEGPVLKDHAICVEGGKIVQIAPQKEFSDDGEVINLSNTILLPGLINCHCHLELSQLPAPLPYPGSFVLWIDELTRAKLGMTPADTEAAIKIGIQKLLAGGTTTVADHVSVGTDLKPLFDSPLDGIVYLEVMGIERQRAEKFYEEAKRKMDRGPWTKDHGLKFKIIPTPHAPYSLLPEIFQKLTSPHPHTRASAPLSIHIAESAEEFLLFKENCGPLFEFLQLKGKTPPSQNETPIHYLERLGLLPDRFMAIHANYLEDEDITALLRAEATVVHCPGSHAYFEHDRFPMGFFLDAEINVALGTDSLASNESLSMLRQMQIVLDTYPELTPESVLKMATLNGAKALMRETEIGSLKVNKLANIVGVPLRNNSKSPLDNILLSEKGCFSMIRGICTLDQSIRR